MKLDVLGIHTFDPKETINDGVLSDQIVGTSTGVRLRRFSYEDP